MTLHIKFGPLVFTIDISPSAALAMGNLSSALAALRDDDDATLDVLGEVRTDLAEIKADLAEIKAGGDRATIAAVNALHAKFDAINPVTSAPVPPTP